MAFLSEVFRHYQFDHGLRMLEKGYKASREALMAEVERIRTESDNYEESLENGGEWIGEYEDGYVLWDQSHLYRVQIDDAYNALAEVRNAFAIALYHHWERSAAVWKGTEAKHEQLAEFCALMGYGPSPDLDAVRCLVNHLKHGPNSHKNWLDELRTKHPSFLPKIGSPMFGISDDDLHRIAAVILASGPPSPHREVSESVS